MQNQSVNNCYPDFNSRQDTKPVSGNLVSSARSIRSVPDVLGHRSCTISPQVLETSPREKFNNSQRPENLGRVFNRSITSPQGRLCAAIKNALRLRTRVYRILENGQIPLSNNSLEREIRFTTLVRKNCLFAKSIRGAEANAIYYTLVATAKINKLNVYKYFKYLFDRLPNQKRSDIKAFLPWAEEAQQVCHN